MKGVCGLIGDDQMAKLRLLQKMKQAAPRWRDLF
jgi:hypothetical protein